MKKIFKVISIALVCIAVILIAASIILNRMFPSEKIMKMVSPEISKILKRDVEIKDAGINVFPFFGVKVTGLDISSTQNTTVLDTAVNLGSLLSLRMIDPIDAKIVVNGKKIKAPWKVNPLFSKGDTVVISRRGFTEDKSLFRIENFILKVGVIPLLKGELSVKKILLDKMVVFAEKDETGSFNFDDIASSPDTAENKADIPDTTKPGRATGLPIAFRLENFEIRDASVVFRDRNEKMEIELGDIDQDVSVAADKNLEKISTVGLLEIKHIAVSGTGLPVSKSGMNFSVSHDLKLNLASGDMQINEIRAGFQKNLLILKGTVNDFDKPEGKADIRVYTNKIKMADLLEEIPAALSPEIEKLKAAGYAQLKLSVKGNIADPQGKPPEIDGAIIMRDISFSYSGLSESLNSLRGDINFTENSVKIPDFSFKLGDNPFEIKAEVNDFKKPYIDFSLNQDLDLGIIKNLVALPEGTGISGRIKTDIKASGRVNPDNPLSVKVKGITEIVNISATAPPVKKPVKINGRLTFENNRIELSGFRTDIGKSSVTVNMSIRDYFAAVFPELYGQKPVKIIYSMNSPLWDLNEILGLSVSDITGGKSEGNEIVQDPEEPEGRGEISDDPIIIPEIPPVVFNGRVRFAKIQALTIPVTNASVDINYSDGKLFTGMEAFLFTGKISEKFDLDISDKTDMKIRNRFSSEKMEANDFISGLNDLITEEKGIFSSLKNMDNTIFGKSDINSDIRTHGITPAELKKSLDGDINMSAYNGEIRNAAIISGLSEGVPEALRKYLPDLKNLKFNRMDLEIKIRDENLIIEDFKVRSSRMDLASSGKVSFETVLDIQTDCRFGKRSSSAIVSAQNKIKNSAQKGLQSLAGGNELLSEAAEAAGDRMQGIPVDKDGRVTARIGTKGPLDDLKYSFEGFKSGNAGKREGGANKSSLEAVHNKARDKAAAAREEIEKKVEEKKEEVKKEVRVRTRKGIEKVRKETDKAKKAVEKKGKEALKNLGF